MEAERLERLAAYEDDLAKYREARDRLEKAGDRFLAEVEAYDGEVIRMRKLRAEMLDAFGNDERIAEIDKAVDEDANEVTTTWKAVVGAAEWRLRSSSRPIPPIVRKPESNGADHEGDGTPPDEGRAARILEYFNKS
jgi:hypothetical protein